MGGKVTSNDTKESVVIFAYCFSMLTVIRVCLQSTRERASGSSASGDSARGMEFLHYHLLSPRYGVPPLPFAQPEVWSSSITICSARGMEFLHYHLLSPRYGVPPLPFAQPEVWSSSITICSARSVELHRN
jgi:hypothetical protein